MRGILLLRLLCLSLALRGGVGKICGSVSIDKGTKADQLREVSSCTVIDGSLWLTLISLPPLDPLSPGNGTVAAAAVAVAVAFPHLLEVSGFVALYRVGGLDSLGRLFPRLSVIRGLSQLEGYSLVLFDLPDLRDLGLPWLRRIDGGGVRIESAPNLCYRDSVAWDSVLAPRYLPMRQFTNVPDPSMCGDVCPGRFVWRESRNKFQYQSTCRSGKCWSFQHCQSVCNQTACGERGCRVDSDERVGECCHRNCLAGCSGPTERDCVACRFVRLGDECLSACPSGYLELQGWLCILRSECSRPPARGRQRMWALDGRCVAACPPGHLARNDSCVPCSPDRPCARQCAFTARVHSVKDIDAVRGCASIDAVVISLADNIPDLDIRLLKAFSNLTEIRNYLTVTQSRDLTSLGFLASLRAIHGLHTRGNASAQPSLRIEYTDFLQHLWNRTDGRRVTVSHGRVQIRMNRRLCPRAVREFASGVINVTDGYDTHAELSLNTNGDLALCIDSTFDVTVAMAHANAIVLHWPQQPIPDARDLLGYSVYYRLVPPNSPPVTYADPSTCEIRQWHTVFTQCADVYANPAFAALPRGRGFHCHLGGNCSRCVGNCDGARRDPLCSHLIDGLRPASRYALFVVPHILQGQQMAAARSRLAFAGTLPDRSSPPHGLASRVLDHSRIQLTWSRPLVTNGNVTHYLLWVRAISGELASFALHDYCDGPPHRYHMPLLSPQPETPSSPPPLPSPSPSASPPSSATPPAAAAVAAVAGAECQCEPGRKLEQQRELVYLEDTLLQFIVQQRTLHLRRLPMDFQLRGAVDELDPVASLNAECTGGANVTCLTGDSLPDFGFPGAMIAKQVLWPGLKWPFTGSSSSNSSRGGTNLDRFLSKSDTGRASASNASGAWDAARAAFSRCLRTACPSHIAKLADGPVGKRTLPENYTVVRPPALANTTAFIVEGLSYFTFYEFTVVACQDNDERLCSHPARTMLRTHAYLAADTIPNMSLVQVPSPSHLGSLVLAWRQPAHPNGPVIYYEVQVQSGSGSGSGGQPYCVSYQDWLNRGQGSTITLGNATAAVGTGGTVLRGLADGWYTVRVRPVTLRGGGVWTSDLVVSVSGLSDHRTTLLSGLALALLAAALPVAAFLAWRCRAGRRRATIVTQNPDYWSYTYEPDEWEVPRDQVTYRCEDLLGTGSFGCVYRGVVRSLSTPAARYLGRSEDISVAVKNVSDGATMRERHEFLLEAAHMKKFRQCAHVVRLIGVVSENVPTLVLMELMENGDLKTCLRSMRPESEPPHRRPPPDTQRLAMWCAQIADGMYYLETKKYIHRDLAARNCMVTAEYSVKIGDFGMTRDVYYTDYYKKEGQAPLPIRWMAPESLRDGVFTTASDVWSYGVVLWEICSLASQPFMSRSNEEVLHLVKSGKTLEPPDGSPDFMADLMNRCWAQKPRLRASFAAVLAFLDGLAPDSFRLDSWYHNRPDVKQLQQPASLRRAPSNGYVQISV